MVAKHAQAQSSQFGSPAATVRHAAHVRDEYNLACAPMAFVTGLEWCPPEALVFLVRGVLVVVNTSDSPIILSAEAKVLLSVYSPATGPGTPTRPSDDDDLVGSRHCGVEHSNAEFIQLFQSLQQPVKSWRQTGEDSEGAGSATGELPLLIHVNSA